MMKYLADNFEPSKYHLQLDIDKWAETVHGKVAITGVCKAKKILLDAVDTKFVQVLVDGQKADYKYLEQDGILEIVAPKSGQLVVEIEFENRLKHNLEGAYISTYQYQGEEQRVVVTQFESHYARNLFPCVDEPGAKAVFELEITTPDDKDLVLANTPMREKQGKTVIFEPTPKMSTYLLAFVIGEFQSRNLINAEGITITSYCVLNQDANMLDFANEVAAKTLEFYDEKFGTPYPLAKLDQVALPDFDAGAMENWGLVTYRESCMLVDDKSSHGVKQMVTSVIAHELAHQWFGNLVTPKWWDELWLNESFANAMEYYAVDAIHPEYQIWDNFWTSDCWSALRRDALPGVQAVQQPVNSPDEIQSIFDPAIVYAKGAHLMVMLIRLMGEDNFFAGVRDYFATNQYKTTCGDDVWQAFKPHADFDVKEFMTAWIMQPGYPVITDGKQQKFLLDGTTDDSKWPLPKVTDDMTGHYILNLTAPELEQKLADFHDLSLEQKLRLLIDRILLSKTDLAESVSLFGIIDKCHDSDNSSVWEMLFSAIGALRVFAAADDDLNEQMKKYVGQLVEPKIAKISLIPEENEPLNLIQYRDVVLALGYYAKLPELMKQLSDLYDDDLSKIHPELLDFVVGAKVFVDEDKCIDKFIARYPTEPHPEFRDALLAAITDVRGAGNCQKVIELLNKPEVVRPQDHLHFYLYLRRNRDTRAATLDWLLDNWDYVCTLNGRGAEDYPRYTANTIYTRDEAEKFYKFFDQFKTQPSMRRILEIARGDIEARLGLIEKDKISINKHLV